MHSFAWDDLQRHPSATPCYLHAAFLLCNFPRVSLLKKLPLLWVLKPEWVLPHLHLAKVYIICSWGPPLVLHIADLLTVSIVGHWPGSYFDQGYYCGAAVSLESAIIMTIRPRVLALHLATHILLSLCATSQGHYYYRSYLFIYNYV